MCFPGGNVPAYCYSHLFQLLKLIVYGPGVLVTDSLWFPIMMDSVNWLQTVCRVNNVIGTLYCNGVTQRGPTATGNHAQI